MHERSLVGAEFRNGFSENMVSYCDSVITPYSAKLRKFSFKSVKDRVPIAVNEISLTLLFVLFIAAHTSTYIFVSSFRFFILCLHLFNVVIFYQIHIPAVFLGRICISGTKNTRRIWRVLYLCIQISLIKGDLFV